jgi:hypothetical protein
MRIEGWVILRNLILKNTLFYRYYCILTNFITFIYNKILCPDVSRFLILIVKSLSLQILSLHFLVRFHSMVISLEWELLLQSVGIDLFTSGAEVSFISIVLHLLGGEGGGISTFWTSFQFSMSVDYPLKQELIASAQKTIDWPTCLVTVQSLNWEGQNATNIVGWTKPLIYNIEYFEIWLFNLSNEYNL